MLSNRLKLIENLNFNQKFDNLINHPEFFGLLQQAIDQDKPILSPAIKINLDGKKERQVSFLINSVKRNKRFIAWIIAPIEMEVFFKSVAEIRYPAIDIDIYDISKNSARAKVITEDEAGVKELMQYDNCVFLFMSSKDIYKFEEMLIEAKKSI